MSDFKFVLFTIGLFAFVIAWMLFYILAPCSWLDWMPIQSWPGRCLTFK